MEGKESTIDDNFNLDTSDYKRIRRNHLESVVENSIESDHTLRQSMTDQRSSPSKFVPQLKG